MPRPAKLAVVDCEGCHGDQTTYQAASLHGAALKRGDKLEPVCA